jgi:hypothetical protein
MMIRRPVLWFRSADHTQGDDDVSDLFVARQSGTVMLDGRRHAIRRGVTVARAGSTMLAKHPRLFEPLKIHYDAPGKGRRNPAPVEQATAAPGERRTVRLPEPAPEPPPPAEPTPAATQRPPTSGPGSGAPAWREYAAAVTGRPVGEFAAMGRDDIVALLAEAAEE